MVVACFVAVVAAAPNEFKRGLDGSPLVIEYDVGTHQHIQTGDAGNAVRGSYSCVLFNCFFCHMFQTSIVDDVLNR